MKSSRRFEPYEFKGAKLMSGTIGATALVDASVAADKLVATITSNAHGLLAGSLIMLQSLATAMYNGMKKIDAVATNTFNILLPNSFSALTPAGTEAWFAGVTYEVPWELGGFRLHMSATGGTSENLTMTLDADAGSQYDTVIYSADMNAVADIEKDYDPPLVFDSNDILKFAYANTNSRTWGLTVFARRKY